MCAPAFSVFFSESGLRTFLCAIFDYMRKLSLPLFLTVLVFLSGASSASEGDVGVAIVGGEQAPAGSWPSHALVRPGGIYLCGGTLVASRWVLTAAHCLEGVRARDTTVALGTKRSSSPGKTIAQMFSHPRYNSRTFQNDIALLRLRSGSYLPSARLARPEDAPYFSGGQDGFIAGWGRLCFETCSYPELLRQATLEIRSQEECADIYGEYWDNGWVCAGGGSPDACQGDSGGPLEVDSPSGRLLLGVVSWGIECAKPEYPGAYTKIPKYLSWIGSHITSRVSAPGALRVRSKTAFSVFADDPLDLPVHINPVLVGRERQAFSVSSNCLPLQPAGNCAVRVRARSRKFSRATLQLRNRAGVVMSEVFLAGRR